MAARQSLRRLSTVATGKFANLCELEALAKPLLTPEAYGGRNPSSRSDWLSSVAYLVHPATAGEAQRKPDLPAGL